MLTNAELERLDRLVADELAAGRGGATSLGPLQEVIDASVIRSGDLEFSDFTSTEPLPNHILLCNQSPLWTQLRKVYPAISGCGAHYNGMFGNCEMLRDANAAWTITNLDIGPARVAEQVLLCVRVLGTSQASLMPELAAAVRRHLSGIMLKYPVLLHPAIQVPNVRSYHGQTEYAPLASALATTAHGALPRYSHFRTKAQDKNQGVDQALVERLTAFAKHPCVRMLFSRAPVRVRQDPAGPTARDRRIKMGKESLLRTTLCVAGPRVEFLASVMEMEELAGVYPEPVRPFWSAVKGQERLLSQLDAMLAASIAAASGMVHVAAMQGSLPDSMRAHQPEPTFLAGILRRCAHLFGESADDSGVGKAIVKSAQRRIFLGRSDSLASAELQHNTRNLALGLTCVGFCNSPAEAARFLVEACVGSLRPDGNLPRAETTGALGFLKVIDELGGLGDTDETVIASAGRLKKAASSEGRPFMDSWVQAAELFATERVMTSVIRRATAETQPQAMDRNQAADGAPARRRARAAV